MASCKEKYSENFFKKDEPSETSNNKHLPYLSQKEDRNLKSTTDKKTSSSDETKSDDESSCEGESSSESSDDESSCEGETSSGDESSSDDETGTNDELSGDETSSEDISYCEDETCSGDESKEFNSEDKLICRLYRQAVDVIMYSKNLRESVVDNAIRDIKLKLLKTYKRGFRKFPRIDFSRPENCCGYLRRYAICHTGLVKKIMWNFFANKNNTSKTAKEDIISKSYLKVISLGGGPGNDLVGFCSALQEIPNNVEQLELTVVDSGTGWKRVFPEILKKAKGTDFGSISQFVLKNIITRFIKADLTNGEVFRDTDLSAALDQADLLLMVKLISYLPSDAEPDALIYNIVDSMKPNAKLIFIDYPYDGQFFREIESLDCIYHDALRYELSFKPKRIQSPSISSTYAHVAIHQKKKFQEDSSDSEED